MIISLSKKFFFINIVTFLLLASLTDSVANENIVVTSLLSNKILSDINYGNNYLYSNIVKNHQKGLLAELIMDKLFSSGGYNKLELDKKVINTGIDGIYIKYNNNRISSLIVCESKYGSSKLGETKFGKQFSDQWISHHLLNLSRNINLDNIQSTYLFAAANNIIDYKKRIINFEILDNSKIKIIIQDVNNNKVLTSIIDDYKSIPTSFQNSIKRSFVELYEKQFIKIGFDKEISTSLSAKIVEKSLSHNNLKSLIDEFDYNLNTEVYKVFLKSSIKSSLNVAIMSGTVDALYQLFEGKKFNVRRLLETSMYSGVSTGTGLYLSNYLLYNKILNPIYSSSAGSILTTFIYNTRFILSGSISKTQFITNTVLNISQIGLYSVFVKQGFSAIVSGGASFVPTLIYGVIDCRSQYTNNQIQYLKSSYLSNLQNSLIYSFLALVSYKYDPPLSALLATNAMIKVSLSVYQNYNYNLYNKYSYIAKLIKTNPYNENNILNMISKYSHFPLLTLYSSRSIYDLYSNILSSKYPLTTLELSDRIISNTSVLSQTFLPWMISSAIWINDWYIATYLPATFLGSTTLGAFAVKIGFIEVNTTILSVPLANVASSLQSVNPYIIGTAIVVSVYSVGSSMYSTYVRNPNINQESIKYKIDKLKIKYGSI